MNRHSGLGCIFDPQSIAVIGATTREGSVGRTFIENLTKGSRREKLFAVNPKHEEVLGVRCYRDPIDVLGDAGPEQYGRALEIAIHDPNSDGLLAILAPQGMTDPARVAEHLKAYARGSGKPALASWMGGKLVSEGVAILNKAGISTFAYPDTAARAFCYMWRYTDNLRGIYETPSLTEEVKEGDDSREAVTRMLEIVRRSGRTLLTEIESKQVLGRYGIPTVDTKPAHSEDEAARLTHSIGFPIVLKVYSETVTHKHRCRRGKAESYG